MADQHAGNARAEAAADRVHELPHARARGAVALHRRANSSACSSAWRIMPTTRRMARVQARVGEREVPDDRARRVGEYLASVNLSGRDRWNYELKTLPRPTGRGHAGHRHRIRPAAQDHRAPRRAHRCERVSSGTRTLSNPISGGSTRAPAPMRNLPIRCRSPTFPTGALALEPDQDGNWWLALMFQGGLARFDPRTQDVPHFPVAAGARTPTRRSNPW